MKGEWDDARATKVPNLLKDPVNEVEYFQYVPKKERLYELKW